MHKNKNVIAKEPTPFTMNDHPYPESPETIWESLGILDYSIVPHYASDHTESNAADKVVRYMAENKILFKAIKDGEVLIF